MKSCVIRRRFHTSEAAGLAVTVNLEPGFGVPKACLIMYTETSAATDSFDTTLAYIEKPLKYQLPRFVLIVLNQQ